MGPAPAGREVRRQRVKGETSPAGAGMTNDECRMSNGCGNRSSIRGCETGPIDPALLEGAAPHLARPTKSPPPASGYLTDVNRESCRGAACPSFSSRSYRSAHGWTRPPIPWLSVRPLGPTDSTQRGSRSPLAKDVGKPDRRRETGAARREPCRVVVTA